MQENKTSEIDGRLVKPAHGFSIPTSFAFGKQIGSFKGHAIYDVLIDNHGVIRDYKGVVTNTSSAVAGAIIAGPGLLYEPRTNALVIEK